MRLATGRDLLLVYAMYHNAIQCDG